MPRRIGDLAAPVVWSLYVLWRAPGWGWLAGVPLTPLATACLALVWWQWWVRRRLPLTRLVVVLTIAKIVVSPVLVERGFSASYFNNAHWLDAPERGLYHPDVSDTRLDPRLSFGGPGDPDLPLFFHNDVTRFNFPRAQIGYSVVWSGYLTVEGGEPLTVYLRGGPGLTAVADVDGFAVATLSPAATEVVQPVRLRPGLRRLSIRLAGSYGAPRTFEAGLLDIRSGTRQPFDASTVIVFRAPPWRLAVSGVVARLSPLADLAVIGALLVGLALGLYELSAGVLVDWRRAVFGFGALLAVVEAFWFARPFSGRLILLSAGDDWLTYESYARDILLHGPLMALGRPVGSGAPYYYQPLYPYFVALGHLLCGESLWGVYLLQRLLLAITIAGVWSIADLLFGADIGLVGLVAAVAFVSARVTWLTSTLLNEILFIPLLVVWALSLCRLAVRASPGRSVAGGIWGGLATLTRSTLILGWPLVLAALAVVFRRRQWRLAPLMAVFVVACAVISTATLRNWIVARTFVPITTSFGVNFYLGNPEAARFRKNPPHTTWLERVTVDRYVLPTIEFIHAEPGRFFEGLERKAAYTLGWFGALPPRRSDEPAQKVLVATWVLAVAGCLMLLWPGVRSGTPGATRAIPLLMALSQFVAVVLVFPHVYVDRLILPFYVLLLPYAAVGPGVVLGRLRRSPRFRTYTNPPSLSNVSSPVDSLRKS